MSDRRWGDTTSKKGEVSRVFVGNLDNSVVCDELENKFKRYGKIIGIDINSNGFGFIQFDQVEDAKRAVQNEVGTMLKGRKIECRMFDKSGSKKRGRDRSRSPVNRRQPFDNQPRGGGGGGGGMSSGPGPMFNAGGPPPMIGMGMGGSLPSGPMNPPGQQQVNDVEIIVISKDQWAFAEMVERKIRQETGIKFIDILFLHSPQHISMTLNDLFERRTLYAVVIAPENEEHQTMTVHVLHNQMEYRNIPVDKAVGLISEDYQKFTFSSGGQQPSNSGGIGVPVGGVMGGLAPVRESVPVFNVRGDGGSASHQRNGSSLPPPSQQLQPVLAPSSQEKRLPEDVAYVLRTTLTEGGVQFLSLQQIDTVIDYFSRERERMTSQSRHQQQPLPLPPLPVQQPSVPYANNSNYPGHPSSIYGPGIGQQNNSSASMHQQHNMDKVPDVLKLVQESDVLQKLLAGVIPSGAGNNSQSSGANHPHRDPSNSINHPHRDPSNSMHQGYNVGNNHSIGATAAGLNASRRVGSNDLGGLSRGGTSGIGGADRGYGSRF